MQLIYYLSQLAIPLPTTHQDTTLSEHPTLVTYFYKLSVNVQHLLM